MAGRRPSQRTPRWTAAIHRKPSSPAVLGTTRLRSWGPRTVQGVPGLSSLQGVSRGGFPRLFQLLGAPGILGLWLHPSHLCPHLNMASPPLLKRTVVLESRATPFQVTELQPSCLCSSWQDWGKGAHGLHSCLWHSQAQGMGSWPPAAMGVREPQGVHPARGEPGYQDPACFLPHCLPATSLSDQPRPLATLSGLSGDSQLWTLGSS